MRQNLVSARRIHPGPPALLFLAILACESEIRVGPGETLHPTPENAPPPDASPITTDSVPSGLSEEVLAEWRRARDRLLGTRTTMALGSEEEGPELFGMIGDAAFDPDGNVLVADMVNYELRIFGPDGSHLASFGGEGEGPLEFKSRPHSIEVLSGGSILVATGGRMKTFAPAVAGHDYQRTISVYSRDICLTSQGRLFTTVHDTRGTERVLHEVDVAGDSVLHSFGHGYRHQEWLNRNQLSDGTIACLEDPVRLLFSFADHPIIRAHYPGEDEPIWTAALQDFVQPYYLSTDRGIRMASNIAEITDKPHVLGERHIVWQTGLRRVLRERLRTYLLDAETGRGALISEDFPRIMKMTPDRLVAAWNDPYPRIEVRELPD